MGRGPLLKRQLHSAKRWGPDSPARIGPQTLCGMRPPLTATSDEVVVLCGISSPFEELFPTRGQVTHVLRTRAPLYSPSCPGFRVRLACVRHAASVRSEPGSNSPHAGVPTLLRCPSLHPLFSCQRANSSINVKKMFRDASPVSHAIPRRSPPVAENCMTSTASVLVNYGQAGGPISTGQLNTLPCVHLPPIHLVISEGPSGRPHLGRGFPLRCFQRLSRPHMATERCRWRDNSDTRGASIPVLSYWGRRPASLLRPRQIGTELSHDVLNPARGPL